MKATLYRLPARNVLVLEARDGTTEVSYPPSEVRAGHIAQDAGAPYLTFGSFEELLKRNASKK